jgi:hypothetical protein
MDDVEIDAICERIVNMPAKDKVAFLLGMLEKVTDEGDRQRARVLELEGQAGDRERHLSDALKDMRAERDRSRERIAAYEGSLEAWEEMDRVIHQSSLAAQALIERTPRGVGRAIVLGAQLLGRAEEAEAERDRLRAVVEAAQAYVEAEVDDQCPDAEYFRDRLVAALAALDGSAEAPDG